MYDHLARFRDFIRGRVIPFADMGLSESNVTGLVFPDDLPPVLAVLSGLSKVDGKPLIVRLNADGTVAGTTGASTVELVDANGTPVGTVGNPLYIGSGAAPTAQFLDIAGAPTLLSTDGGYWAWNVAVPYPHIYVQGTVVSTSIPGGGQVHMWLDSSWDGANWNQLSDMGGFGVGTAHFWGVCGPGTQAPNQWGHKWIRVRYSGLNGGVTTITGSVGVSL